MYLLRISLIIAALLASGCGRYFPGPIRPTAEAEQAPRMTVKDDGTVSYNYERLEISLRPMTDAELNRSFPVQSSRGAQSTNPYTYGDWTPLGETYTPSRFTVFLLKTKNYAYPKVRVDPQQVVIRCQNRRVYRPLDLLQLSEYYGGHALAWAGNSHDKYRQNVDILRRTMYKPNVIFSGQEDEGYIIFPPLADDVTSFSITLEDIILRFNYANEPVETVQLTYQFKRDVYKGFQPPASFAMEK